MVTRAQQVGVDGETLVATYLQKQGAQIIARNWRIKEGEIDIVARLQGMLLFVEVKSRTSSAYGHRASEEWFGIRVSSSHHPRRLTLLGIRPR